LTKKLLMVRWNTPLGVTGAADAGAGVGAGAGAGPGKGAGGGLLRSLLFSHPPNLIFAKLGNPGASRLIYILRCRYHARGQKTLFTRGELSKVRYIHRIYIICIYMVLANPSHLIWYTPKDALQRVAAS
jgi:hypothetical protein